MNHLTNHELLIISKYFNSISDYINLIKTNKEYKDTIEQFKYRRTLFDLVALLQSNII